LKYADEQMDFGRRDGCPVVGIFRSLPYQDCGRNITKKCTMMNVHLIHLQHYLNKLPHVCNKQILYWYEVSGHFAWNSMRRQL